MISQVESVLLIDDDRATNFFNERIVGKHADFKKVFAVQSGVEALTYLTSLYEQKKALPSLIFLDINMPGMNGWEFLEAFEALNKGITSKVKVILLSTSSSPDEVHKSMTKYTVADYINKPLTLGLLDQVISNHFNG